MNREDVNLNIREASCCGHCKHLVDESFYGCDNSSTEEQYCGLLLKAGVQKAPQSLNYFSDAFVNLTDYCDKFEK